LKPRKPKPFLQAEKAEALSSSREAEALLESFFKASRLLALLQGFKPLESLSSPS